MAILDTHHNTTILLLSTHQTLQYASWKRHNWLINKHKPTLTLTHTLNVTNHNKSLLRHLVIQPSIPIYQNQVLNCPL
jgi:hypothetical protein